jgi:hypothetical protein
VPPRNAPVTEEIVVLVVELVDVVVSSVVLVVSSVVDVVSVVDDVVSSVVDVVTSVVLVVGGHGFGSHAPGPTSMPFAVAHPAGVRSMHTSKAPMADPCTQHWIGASVVVVVLVTVTVVVLLVDGTVVVLVVATGGHGFGSHVPVPTSMPLCAAHASGVATRVQVSNAPIGDDCTQHCVWPGQGAQQLVPVPTVPPFATHLSADGWMPQCVPTMQSWFV